MNQSVEPTRASWAKALVFTTTFTLAACGGTESPAEPKPPPSTSSTDTCVLEPQRDVQFSEVEGVDAALLRLDAYPLSATERTPAVVFVHGGGWVEGDKTDNEASPTFAHFFRDRGYALVSTNYRLINDDGSRDADWRDQPTDVAAAVAWVVDHADTLCVDPERIVLMGHSAGAHLAALTGTDPRYLGEHGLAPSDLAGVIAFDVNAYDIPFAIENGARLGVPGAPNNLRRLFGTSLTTQEEASPIAYVSSDLPSFLVAWAPVFHTLDQTLSQEASDRFVARLNEAGVAAETLAAPDDDHSSLIMELGSEGDAETERVRIFLEEVAR